MRRYGDWLRRRCWFFLAKKGRRIPLDQEVEELVQEVYCRLLENRSQLRGFRGENEGAWRSFLSRVVRSVVLDYLRHRSAVKRSIPVSNPSSSDAPEAARSWNEVFDLLAGSGTSPEQWAQARQRRRLLIDRCRRGAGGRATRRNVRILWLALLEGWSSREISPRVALSASAVDSVVSRARRRLAAEGIDLPVRS